MISGMDIGTQTGAFLAATGVVAGAVDAIAGGGALIALPVVMLVLGPGATAIGTNKVGGLIAALVALIVYARRGHVAWREGIVFSAVVAAAAMVGAYVAPHLPTAIFPWILVVTCPIILYVVWQRAELMAHAPTELANAERAPVRWGALLLAGVACGFYDGVWGPGGGTFMFFALLSFARLPLLTALALSKLANAASATLGLSVYVSTGNVQFGAGGCLGAGMLVGAYAGARLAHWRSVGLIRPVLTGVVVLLLGTVLYHWVHVG